jgi:hypothetical protein
MGIKFHCPNGHKLNVKSFLAGKKGVCPKCGTKFRIPAESEPALRNSEVEETESEHVEEGKGGNGAPVTAGAVAATASAGPPIPVATAEAGSTRPAAPFAGSPSADPIAEAPAAIWYVRPPSGGQYGPAKGDVMRKWLSEGRVSSDSLVWREGWTDWQAAGKLFPSLQSASGPPVGAAAAAIPISANTTRSAVRPAVKPRSTSGVAIAGIVFLALACLILFVVLAAIFFTQTK